jgi:hypothetical protein
MYIKSKIFSRIFQKRLYKVLWWGKIFDGESRSKENSNTKNLYLFNPNSNNFIWNDSNLEVKWLKVREGVLLLQKGAFCAFWGCSTQFAQSVYSGAQNAQDKVGQSTNLLPNEQPQKCRSAHTIGDFS